MSHRGVCKCLLRNFCVRLPYINDYRRIEKVNSDSGTITRKSFAFY